MNTNEKAHIAPVLQAIANIPKISLKALNLDLYYIPRTKTTPSKLAKAIDDLQLYYYNCYALNISSMEASALLKLYIDYNIIVMDHIPEDIHYNNYIVSTININSKDYKIIIGL